MDHFTEWTFEGDLNNIHEAYRALQKREKALSSAVKTAMQSLRMKNLKKIM